MSNKHCADENVVNSIEALSVAAEFLLCAIRALASGADPGGTDVLNPVQWAKAKLDEGMLLIKPSD